MTVTLSSPLRNLADEVMWSWCDRGRDPADAVVMLVDPADPYGRALIEAVAGDVEAFEQRAEGMVNVHGALAVDRGSVAAEIAKRAPHVGRALEEPPEPGKYWMVWFVDGGARLSGLPVPQAKPKPDGWNRIRQTWMPTSSKKRSRRKRQAAKRDMSAPMASDVATRSAEVAGIAAPELEPDWKDPHVADLADLGWLQGRAKGTPAEEIVVVVGQFPGPTAVAFLVFAATEWRMDAAALERADTYGKLAMSIDRSGVQQWCGTIGQSMLVRQLDRPPPNGGYWVLMLFGKSIGLTSRPIPDRSLDMLESKLNDRIRWRA